ncbi:CKLF-like MARVEL transmembrane domain-containing protein 8 isoform 2-T2 [Guaruba guarouba]
MEPPVSQPQEQTPRPRSHTVTTTSSSFTANLSASSSTLAYDREFLRTLPGLLMVTEIGRKYWAEESCDTNLRKEKGEKVLGLLVWTLIAGTEYFLYPAFGWVMFVAVFYWVLTVFFLIIYMTMTYTRIPQVPWTTVVNTPCLCCFGNQHRCLATLTAPWKRKCIICHGWVLLTHVVHSDCSRWIYLFLSPL